MTAHIYLELQNENGQAIEGASTATGKHEKQIEVTGWRQPYSYQELDDTYSVNQIELQLKTLEEERSEAIGKQEQDKMLTLSNRIERLHKKLELAKKIEKADEEGNTQEVENIKKEMGKEISTGHDPFTFTKYLDIASPILMDCCWHQKRFKKCVFTIYRPLAQGKNEKGAIKLAEDNHYLTIELTDAYIQRYELNQGDEAWPQERIQLQYTAAKFIFRVGEPDTGKYSQQKVIGYDWKLAKVKKR